MNVNIICVGKLKENFWREACAEYLKRLQGCCKASVVELSESRLPQNPSEAEIAAALSAEGRAMREYLERKKTLNIAMCVEGEQISSEELSEKLQWAGITGTGTVNFYIGSSFGISKDIKKSCDLKLSVSKMTLPHQLCRVVLLEQIYRAFSIAAGTKYHK